MIIPTVGQNKSNTITVKITADTSEFEKSIDSCMKKMKELIQLMEQANKLSNTEIDGKENNNEF